MIFVKEKNKFVGLNLELSLLMTKRINFPVWW